jgi:eukaryotic-like serine/threonine-protein kinase
VEPSAGQLILGKYRVDRIIGTGGFGYVVAATHVHLRERVAIKFLHANFAADPGIAARFLHEAQAAAHLRSHHTARAIDVGTLPDGQPYIVMEYLDGEDLECLVRRSGRLPPAVAAGLILEACEALAEAHALGIVHRDLKPSNIFLARGPGRAAVVKVLDFGISKFETGGSQSLTRTSTVLGSPMYAAPEQLRSTRDADVRSDIWSLGVTLYQLVAGEVPFPGETMSEVCVKVAIDPVPPLSRSLGIPPAFETIIKTCLEKDPARRFRDVPTFAAALAKFAGDAGTSALQRIKEAGGVTIPPSAALSFNPGALVLPPGTLSVSMGEMAQRQSQSQIATTPPGRRRRVVFVTAGALIGVAVVVAAVAAGGGGSPQAGVGPRLAADSKPIAAANAPVPAPAPQPAPPAPAATPPPAPPPAAPPAARPEPAAKAAPPDAGGASETARIATAAPAPAAAAPAPERAPAAAAAPPPRAVEIELDITPPTATVQLDGKKTTERTLRFSDPGGGAHELVVSAGGYLSVTQKLRLSEAPPVIRIALRRAPAPVQRAPQKKVSRCPPDNPLCGPD